MKAPPESTGGAFSHPAIVTHDDAAIIKQRDGRHVSGATVTATQSTTGTYRQSLTVVALTGAAGVGASAAESAASGAPAVSLSSTRAGSLVFGSGYDWNGVTPRTIGAGQTLVHECRAARAPGSAGAPC